MWLLYLSVLCITLCGSNVLVTPSHSQNVTCHTHLLSVDIMSTTSHRDVLIYELEGPIVIPGTPVRKRKHAKANSAKANSANSAYKHLMPDAVPESNKLPLLSLRECNRRASKFLRRGGGEVLKIDEVIDVDHCSDTSPTCSRCNQSMWVAIEYVDLHSIYISTFRGTHVSHFQVTMSSHCMPYMHDQVNDTRDALQ